MYEPPDSLLAIQDLAEELLDVDELVVLVAAEFVVPVDAVDVLL